MTPEEEARETEKAKTYFGQQRKLMQTHHATLYAELQRLFPLSECWPELNEK